MPTLPKMGFLENVDTKTRYNQYAVTIDLAFQDDFF